MERATRYLIANLDSYRAQIFLQDYLLPAVRKSIANNKRLDIHLFIALKRSVYKPTAFFKGLVFGLLSDKPLLKEC
jgi:essential nuclear protein 1